MPSLISITRIAKSAKLPPLFLKLLKAACPGVSIKRNPGISNLMPFLSSKGHALFKLSAGNNVNEIF